MTEAAGDISYRLDWRTRTSRAGAHRSSISGSGGMFRDLTSLLDARDPRRIDLRQTLRDPYDAIHVRRFEQTSAITVTVIADMSGSMTFAGRTRKHRLVSDLIQAISNSAIKTGDAFALIAVGATALPELSQPATRSRATVARAIDAMTNHHAGRSSIAGLPEAASLVGTRRGLVFLVSDFLMADGLLTETFERLSRHDVIPIALYDSAEIEALPDWGLMELDDLETGRRRLVVLRPSVKDAWRRRIEARRSDFRNTARRFGREPFEVTDRIEWDRLAAHLKAGGS